MDKQWRFDKKLSYENMDIINKNIRTPCLSSDTLTIKNNETQTLIRRTSKKAAVQSSLGLRSVGQVGTTVSHLPMAQRILASPWRSLFIGVMVCNQNCEWSAIIVQLYFPLPFHNGAWANTRTAPTILLFKRVTDPSIYRNMTFSLVEQKNNSNNKLVLV